MSIPSSESYLDLLQRGELRELEAAATQHLSAAPDELAALMLAHAQVRRGRFQEGSAALRELARLDPERGALAADLIAMCLREQEELGAAASTEDRRRLDALDPWAGAETGNPIGGEVGLIDGGQADFDDLEDLEAAVGRRLLVFGLHQAWRIPFRAIATLVLSAVSSLQFDDLWVPVEIALWPGQPIERLHGRVPSFYRGSLGDADPLVASGRATRMGETAPIGRRDYRIFIKGQEGLVGIHQFAALTFRR